MRREASSATRTPLALVLALALLPVACTTTDSSGPGDPGNDPASEISASVVVSDVSQPTGIAGLEGQLTFSGLSVELWDGQSWLLVTDAPGTAAVVIGDGSAEATLAATDIPAGDYTKARLTATDAVVDLSATLNDRQYAAQLRPPGDQPLVLEKDVEVIVNADGSRTFRIELEVIQTVQTQLQGGTQIMLVITGELGTVMAPVGFRGSVVAADVSSPLGVDITGTVTFEGLTVELWNGEEWLLVTDQPTTAVVALGDGAAEATLATTDIPDGDYTKARLTAQEGIVDITAMFGGQELSAQFRTPADQPLELEKDVEVIINEDGSRTLRIEFIAVQDLESRLEGGQQITLILTGELGVLSASANFGASFTATDLSDPANADVSGNVTFTGLTIEVSADGENWLTVAEESGEAVVSLADGAAAATLMTFEAIPAGPYTRVRLTATDAVVDVTADIDGRQFNAQLDPAGDDPIVIEKELEAIVNEDGTTTFHFDLECIRTITHSTDPEGGDVLIIDGDLGPAQARAG